MKKYYTVLETSQGRYEEKRSVFIAELFPCDSPENAAQLVAAQKSKYWDAKHVVHAFCMADGTVKAADDGEPHGTSGKPVLDVICGAQLKNVLITVARYFGGVLLGTGGLVRAYSSAARDAVENAHIVTMCAGEQYCCTIDYQQYQSLQRLLFAYECIVDISEFGESVYLEFTVPGENSLKLFKDATEAFSGKTEFVLKKSIFYVKK